MTRRFADLPIRAKLTIIVSLASTFTVVVLGSFFLTDKILSFRRNLTQNLSTLARVVGINSTAALTFDVPETAHEILTALHAEPEITYAGILDREGRLFAVYRNPDLSAQIPFDEAFFVQVLRRHRGTTIAERASEKDLSDDHFFSKEYLDIIEPIDLNGRIIGYVVIRADLSRLHHRTLLSILIVLGLTSLLFGVAHLITRRLHRTIIDPIAELKETMEMVSQSQDYHVRVIKKQDDEVGSLIDGFNEMLSQIQKRDQELAMHRDRLEEAVAERTSELSASNAQLKLEMAERNKIQEQLTQAQKMEALGTLAAGVAHDLNNILSGIVGYPDLILAKLPQDSPLRKPIGTIQKSGLKAAAIVQDLLTLARRGVSVPEPVDLKALVENYLQGPEQRKMLSYHTNIHVEMESHVEAAKIFGSPVHLEKMVMNLINNAAEAMSEGGKITIGLSRSRLDRPLPGYDTIREGEYLLLSIADTGTGIAAQDKERIFEPFYTRKKMGRSGTGLGMTVVWGTVKDHNGYIDMESEVGRGTTFYLYFPHAPAAECEASPPQKAAEASPPRGNGETILVVDDQTEQCEIAANILEAVGYRPHTVDSGEAAVEFLKKEPVDLLLLDMVMEPGMDGLETYRRVIEIQPGQRTVIVSGFSESERIKTAQQLGAGAYLHKPYTLKDLASAVKGELLREKGEKMACRFSVL